MAQTTWQPDTPLTMAHVGEVYQTQRATWPTSGTWQIDLSQIQKFDSAGIALLLAMIRHAQEHKVKLTITHWSDDVQLLIEAQGLGDIFKAYKPGFGVSHASTH
jgi:anti-anti-sigma factor